MKLHWHAPRLSSCGNPFAWCYRVSYPGRPLVFASDLTQVTCRRCLAAVTKEAK